MRTRRAAQLSIIENTLRNPHFARPIVAHELRGPVVEMRGINSDVRWHVTVPQLAEALFTALYGRPDQATRDAARTMTSRLVQAEDARARRDAAGEVDALMSAAAELESAPWYPARHGDIVHIGYDHADDGGPDVGETYLIERDPDIEGLFGMRLLASSHPRASATGAGAYATNRSDNPLETCWFEAGPHRITLVRHGRPVHIGAHWTPPHHGPAVPDDALAVMAAGAEDYRLTTPSTEATPLGIVNRVGEYLAASGYEIRRATAGRAPTSRRNP